MKGLLKAAVILANIGAINWGLTTLGYNLVDMLLGAGVIAQIVYYVIAVSGIYALYTVFTK